MGSLAIIRPVSWAAASGSLSPRVLTPDPKEAIYMEGGQIQLDAGVPVTVDSLFIGYHTALTDQQFAAYATDATYYGGQQVLVPTSQLQPLGMGPPYHCFRRGPTLTSRYWRIDFNNGSSPAGQGYTVGVIALGLSMQLQYGTEWGAGRFIEDTGTAERLFGGGFGIDEGVSAGGYQWTFGDIQPDELRKLYQLVKERRTTRTVLVVEDPDLTDGLNERLHWGLFRKLDAYERLDPQNTKWALQIADWA